MISPQEEVSEDMENAREESGTEQQIASSGRGRLNRAVTALLTATGLNGAAPVSSARAEINHADASIRVAAVREQLASITAELTDARRQMEEHECNAIFAGTDADTSLRQRVVELGMKQSVTSNLLRALETRLTVLREQEDARDKAIKRAAAEEMFEGLVQQHRTKLEAVVSAGFSIAAQFRELKTLNQNICTLLYREFPGDELHRAPRLPPSRMGNLSDISDTEDWAGDLCAFGWLDLVPDTFFSKRTFVAKEKLLRS